MHTYKCELTTFFYQPHVKTFTNKIGNCVCAYSVLSLQFSELIVLLDRKPVPNSLLVQS